MGGGDREGERERRRDDDDDDDDDSDSAHSGAPRSASALQLCGDAGAQGETKGGGDASTRECREPSAQHHTHTHTLTAETRRGCVQMMFAEGPITGSSRMNCGICVDLPHPVLPETMITECVRMSVTISPICFVTGSLSRTRFRLAHSRLLSLRCLDLFQNEDRCVSETLLRPPPRPRLRRFAPETRRSKSSVIGGPIVKPDDACRASDAEIGCFAKCCESAVMEDWSTSTMCSSS